ncbi:Vir protein [Legionella impletisoli]|uniref:Vir protein n=1 Tax=Legionella impletisoli TaxID=343510 RepID=UPI001E50E14F|nr:Vir protein [Legionella impletisoli]
MKRQEQTSSNSKQGEQIAPRINLLFSKFAAFYGHVWRSQFKSEGFMEFAKREWQEALSRFSDEIFNQAVFTCRDFCEMPPTLPQLMQICRDIKKRTSFWTTQSDYTRPDSAIVQAQLQRCKAILAGQQREKN